jgi:signal peptidase II
VTSGLRPAPKLGWFLATLALSLPLDQASKQWIIASFHYGERWVVVPDLLDLTHVRNPGGAFSFLAGAPAGHRAVFFIGTTLLAIALLIVFYRRLEPGARVSAAALGMILGGALGNLIDRMIYGEVIDFLDVHLWSGYTWPTFNLADSFIVVGVAVLIVEIFVGEGERPAEKAQVPVERQRT